MAQAHGTQVGIREETPGPLALDGPSSDHCSHLASEPNSTLPRINTKPYEVKSNLE